jgi:hypothetical protein
MSDFTRLKADIDFVKTLAEEGGQIPLIGGFPLFLAGLVFGGAVFLHYAATVSISPFSQLSSLAIWG